jgi:predicted N-formylglutamate amidohydrolase
MAEISNTSPMRLLGPGDPEPVVVLRQQAQSPFLLTGDHAGRAIPATLGDLGVSDADMERHIAWDIGVGGLGERLSANLDATFIRQSYSRLVVDCNRRPHARGSIPPISDGVVIPGNVGLDDAQIRRRYDEIYVPYQDAIGAALDGRAAPTILVALHSFTPTMGGFDRPWRYGVVHGGDSPFSLAVLEQLRRQIDPAEVGDNLPYALGDDDNTVPLHAQARGLDYLELEVRQDLLKDETGRDEVASLLAPVLNAAARAVAER